MANYNKEFGNCIGPFGFPMFEPEARELDKILEENSKDSAFSYKHVVKSDSFDYFIDKERSDVSTVTDNSVDKDGEVVNPKGLDWSAFQKNPIVTLNHSYWQPPVGKSLWQNFTKNAWKAKTAYIERPESLPHDKEWIPDTVWHMVKSGYMPAKSIGFLPTKGHTPTVEEMNNDSSLRKCSFIFDEAKIYEYAACYIGSNDNALVEDVAKGIIKMPQDLAALFKLEIPGPEPKKGQGIEEKLVVKGISLEQYKGAVKSELENAIRGIQVDTDGIVARLLGRI